MKALQQPKFLLFSSAILKDWSTSSHFHFWLLAGQRLKHPVLMGTSFRLYSRGRYLPTPTARPCSRPATSVTRVKFNEANGSCSLVLFSFRILTRVDFRKHNQIRNHHILGNDKITFLDAKCLLKPTK